MAAVFLLAFVAFLSYMLSGEMEGVDQGIVARVTRFIPLQSVKIVIVVWQILTQVSRPHRNIVAVRLTCVKICQITMTIFTDCSGIKRITRAAMP